MEKHSELGKFRESDIGWVDWGSEKLLKVSVEEIRKGRGISDCLHFIVHGLLLGSF